MPRISCFLLCLAVISAGPTANKRQVGDVFMNFVHPGSRFGREFDGGGLFGRRLEDPKEIRLSNECLDQSDPRCRANDLPASTFLTDHEGSPLGPGFPPKPVGLQVRLNASAGGDSPTAAPEDRFLVDNAPPLPSPPLKRRPMPKRIGLARNSQSRSIEREIEPGEEKPQSRMLRPLFREDVAAPENSKYRDDGSEEEDSEENSGEEDDRGSAEESDETNSHSEEEEEEEEENPERSNEEADYEEEENPNHEESEEEEQPNSGEEEDTAPVESSEEDERPSSDYSDEDETNSEPESQEESPEEEKPEEEVKQEGKPVEGGTPQTNATSLLNSNDETPKKPLSSIEDNGATLSNSGEDEGPGLVQSAEGEVENSEQSGEEKEERPPSDYSEEGNGVDSSDYDEESQQHQSDESGEEASRPSAESSSEESPQEDYDSDEEQHHGGSRKPNADYESEEEIPADYFDYDNASFEQEGGNGESGGVQDGQRPQTADGQSPTSRPSIGGPKGEEQDVTSSPKPPDFEDNNLKPFAEVDGSTTPSAEDRPSLEDDFSFGFDSFEVDPDLIKIPKPAKHYEDGRGGISSTTPESATSCNEEDEDNSKPFGFQRPKKPLGTAKPKPPRPGDEVSITRDRPVQVKPRPGKTTTTMKPVTISALGIVKPGGSIIARVVSPTLQVHGSTAVPPTQGTDGAQRTEAPWKSLRHATALTYLKPPPMDQVQTWFLRMPRGSRLSKSVS